MLRRCLPPRARSSIFGGLAVVATRSALGNNGRQSDGVLTSANYKVRHRATATTPFIRIVYANVCGGGPGPNSITVRAGIETTGGELLPVCFDGLRSAPIEGGGYVVSDPVDVGLTGGEEFYSRTFVSVEAGRRWPVGSLRTLARWGEGTVEGSPAADLTTAGTIAPSTATAYAPVAIIGAADQPVPSVALIGDSISIGSLDSTEVGDYVPGTDLGFFHRAFAGSIGTVNAGKSAERAYEWLDPGIRRHRMPGVSGCTRAIVEYGLNDLQNRRSLAQVQADLTAVWQLFDELAIPVWQTTITPRSASTDSWETTGNQTANLPSEADRTALNDWIRTTPAPLAGYFEIADSVETGRNSGIWKPGYTPDGTHPGPLAHIAMAAALDMTALS